MREHEGTQNDGAAIHKAQDECDDQLDVLFAAECDSTRSGNGSVPVSLFSDEVWEGGKLLSSGDCVWFLTNVECFEEQYTEQSKPRAMFRAWGYELNSKKFGVFSFGLDIARAMVRASVPSLPWAAPLPEALLISRKPTRRRNGGGRLGGVLVEMVNLGDEVRALGARQSSQRCDAARDADATEATWRLWQPKSLVTEKKVEAAALGLSDWFSAGDILRLLGDPTAPVSRVLKRLVRETRLAKTGKGRATRYQVIASGVLVGRKDWTD